MITVVSGLPRSGTSLLMQVLRAGGMPLLTDEMRLADASNPRGYFEFEPVKNLARDASWIGLAEGKAVKIIAQLLKYLPEDRDYHVLFMRRPISEILASQRAMLGRMGKSGGSISDDALAAVFERHLEQAWKHLAARADVKVHEVGHPELIAEPARACADIAGFLGLDLDRSAMAKVVDPALHRQRLASR